MLRSVVARAASEGFLCSTSDVEALLRRMKLSPEVLQQIPRVQLLERLASVVIVGWYGSPLNICMRGGGNFPQC